VCVCVCVWVCGVCVALFFFSAEHDISTVTDLEAVTTTTTQEGVTTDSEVRTSVSSLQMIDQLHCAQVLRSVECSRHAADILTCSKIPINERS
jgi:hypothetical protein